MIDCWINGLKRVPEMQLDELTTSTLLYLTDCTYTFCTVYVLIHVQQLNVTMSCTHNQYTFIMMTAHWPFGRICQDSALWPDRALILMSEQPESSFTTCDWFKNIIWPYSKYSWTMIHNCHRWFEVKPIISHVIYTNGPHAFQVGSYALKLD